MKIKKNQFIYFVLIAPILAKIIEWSLQKAQGFVIIHWIQPIFSLGVSLIVYLILKEKIYKNKFELYHLTFVVGLTYFIKELYNLLFIYNAFSIPLIMIALIYEPIFFWFILGYIPYIRKWIK